MFCENYAKSQKVYQKIQFSPPKNSKFKVDEGFFLPKFWTTNCPGGIFYRGHVLTLNPHF